jgi:minor extracellular serine protease Vpr
VGEKVIGVASFNNTHSSQSAFAVSPDGRLIGYGAAAAAPPPPFTGTFPMARTGTTTTADDGCVALAPGSLTGHVALIRRGTCGFHIKALNAQNAGAAGVVLYNNAVGTFSPTVAGEPAITIPVVAITAVDGALIDGRIAAGPTTMTWTAEVISTPLGPNTAGVISSFSSYGVAPDLALKPDIGAPGGSIRSTYPLELAGYANISGTSMAAPHVAGAVALMLQANPRMSHQGVRAILQNSADPRVWQGNPPLGFLDQVHRQGAGMLDIPGSILATTKIEPGKLSLGESEHGPVTRTLSVKNEAPQPVTYDLSHAPALSTGPNTFTVGATTGSASVAFGAPSITVPAGGTATVDVTVTANPAQADRSLYGGYIVFTPQGPGQVYRVPYAGFKGDYQSIRVLTPTPNGFPWLAQLVGASYFNQPGGATYTLEGDDVPFFLVHFDHQVRRLRMEVFEAGSDKAWHRALDTEYLGRNSGATSFFAFDWDGTTVAGRRMHTVPNGSYVMKISILKALGDDSNPAHWETWTSPVITIARPAASAPTP